MPPGFNKNTTTYDAEGEYIDGDKVRFHFGEPETLGGWEREISSNTILGTPRNVKSWTDLDSQKYLFIGTEKKQYIRTQGSYFDVTPITNTVLLVSVTSTNGSNTFNVQATGHTRNIGDYVILRDGSTVGSVDLNGEFTVTNVIDADNFEVQATTNATSAETISDYNLDILLATGLVDNTSVFGWGSGTWNQGTWGTPRTSSSSITKLRQYSMVEYGEDFIMNPRGGAVYFWDASVGVSDRFSKLSGAETPERANFSILAPGRHLVLLGTEDDSDVFDPLLVRFSDSESLTTWNATSTNQAGSYRLEFGNEIICAEQSRREIIIFTDTSVHAMRRTGGNFVFAFDTISKNTKGPCGQSASVEKDDEIYWMSDKGFHRYNGQVMDMDCSIYKFIFEPGSEGYLNQAQKEKVHAHTNKEFSEITWFYPAGSSTECNRYVTYNYQLNCWYDGTISRTCWEDFDVFDRPYAFSPEGVLFIHEQGSNDDTSPLNSTLQTSFFDIGDGDKIMFVDRFIPDATIEKTMTIELCGRKYPNDTTTEVEKGPYNVRNTTRKFHPRLRAREMSVKYTMNEFDGSFRLGKNRIGVLQDGER